MAEGYGERVGGIEILRIKVHSQCLADHGLDLLLGRSAVAADGDLGLARRVLGDGNARLRRRDDGRALGPAQLEDDLGVLAIEW